MPEPRLDRVDSQKGMVVPRPDFEELLRTLRDRVRDEMNVSDDLAQAIVTEWRTEASRRNLRWSEDDYWAEAETWMEQWFPPGIRSTRRPESTPPAMSAKQGGLPRRRS